MSSENQLTVRAILKGVVPIVSSALGTSDESMRTIVRMPGGYDEGVVSEFEWRKEITNRLPDFPPRGRSSNGFWNYFLTIEEGGQALRTLYGGNLGLEELTLITKSI